jgi:TolB-like protein/tetratricopeptide (TPR) repeat protein
MSHFVAQMSSGLKAASYKGKIHASFELQIEYPMSSGPPLSPAQSPNPSDSDSDHLDSWKEIAAYLRRQVRTLQRWEKQEDLPVHRLQHDTLGSVYAFKSELDAWRHRRQQRTRDQVEPRFPVLRAEASRLPRSRAEFGKVRLLVLAFENLSGDSAQEFFSDGLTEEMITHLSRLEPHRLGVIGRTTTMHYKGSNKRIDQIALELGVDYLLEGSVRRNADRVRITAQLIRATDQTHLWAETYDRDVRDVLALQNDVAQCIAREIRLVLPPQERARLAGSRPVNPEAYEAYLKGRSLWYERTSMSLVKSIEYFQRAIQKEPRYALAHAGLADAYGLLAIIPWDGLSPREAMPKAKAAALKALEIDDSLAEAYASLALVLHRYDWDWQGAEENYKRAIHLNPNNARPHLWYGWLLKTAGRREEALAELKEAEEVTKRIDPLGLVDIRASVANSLYLAQQYDRAIEECRRASELNPEYFLLHYVLGRAYAQKKMFARAIRILEEAVDSHPGNLVLVMGLGHTYAVSGRKAKALKVLEDLREQRKKRYIPAIYIAAIYAGLRDKKQAFAWIEECFQERSDGMTYLYVERLFDSLRSDPRFGDYIRRAGITS